MFPENNTSVDGVSLEVITEVCSHETARQRETNKQPIKNKQTTRNQPANKQQNKKTEAQAVRRRCAEAAGVSNDRLTCGWMISALRLWAPDRLSDK